MKLYLKPILLDIGEGGNEGEIVVGPGEQIGSAIGGNNENPDPVYPPENPTRGTVGTNSVQEMMPLEIPEAAEVAPQAVDEPKRIAPAIEIEPIELG